MANQCKNVLTILVAKEHEGKLNTLIDNLIEKDTNQIKLSELVENYNSDATNIQTTTIYTYPEFVGIKLHFLTNWNPPIEWYEQLINNPFIRASSLSYSEFGNWIAGYYVQVGPVQMHRVYDGPEIDKNYQWFVDGMTQKVRPLLADYVITVE